MTEAMSSMIRARPLVSAAVAIAVVGAATVLGAWFFQYGLGLKPCPLCLEQRYPFYFAIPLAVLIRGQAKCNPHRLNPTAGPQRASF